MSELKPILVFLPGLGEDHRFFKNQTAAFPNSYAADWIDPLPNETLEQYAIRYAADIRTVIRSALDRCPSAPVIVCGHSLGGMVAPYVARELDASACILLGTIRSPDQFPMRFYPTWILMQHRPTRQVLLVVIRLFARLLLFFPWLWQWFVRPKIVRAFVEMPLFRLSELFRMMFDWTYRRRSAEGIGTIVFDKPTLQIHGTCDLILPIRRTHPDIRLEGCGHLFPITHSEKINEMLKDFILQIG